MVLRCLLNHSSQQRFKHEQTWKVTLGVSRIVNFFIWAGFMAADVSQMLQGSEEGHEGTVLIPLIFWGPTVSEAPFRWRSRRKQIRKFSAVTGNTHLRPLTQTEQGTLGRLCHISSLLATSLGFFFSLFFGQLTVVYWKKCLEQEITEHCLGTPPPTRPNLCGEL